MIESKARLIHEQAFGDSRQVEADHHDAHLQAFDDARRTADDHHAAQLDAFEEVRQIAESEQERQIQLEEQKQCRRVFEWLRAPNTDIEHGNLLKIRNEYPNTGAWLLESKTFKEWIHPDYAKIPPLLWLKGIPGSGENYLPNPLLSEK